MTSGKLWPGVHVQQREGQLAAEVLAETWFLKAFSASRSTTQESLPPLKSSAGRSKLAATSRRMKMASSSSASRCSWSRPGSRCSMGVGAFMPRSPWLWMWPTCSPHSLASSLLPPPAPGAEVFAQRDGARAGLAADAGEELVVQRVVGHLHVQCDVVPHVVPAPVGQGLNLVRPASSSSLKGTTERAPDCSRRSPVTQALRPRQQTPSGSSLRRAQQALRRSMLSRMAHSPCCCTNWITVGLRGCQRSTFRP
jgi:hypothetical protein